MRFKLILLIGLFCTFLCHTGYSQNDLNGLKITDYGNISVLVEELSNEALDIGLTKDRIQSRTEIRLRQVGLKPNSKDRLEHLYVNISVLDFAFSISIEFKRPVFFYEDFLNPDSTLLAMTGSTYAERGTGTHGGDSEYIISSLDQFLDSFISKYLRAND